MVDTPLRLSVAFGLGAAFRPATMFDLDVAVPGGTWSTDAHPKASNREEWTISTPNALTRGRLAVSVGVIRDHLGDVRKHLGPEVAVLHMHLPVALASAEDVQASVRAIKDTVSQAAAHLLPAAIDLFFLGPGVLAMALGHRWNAMPPTQFFERDGSLGYVPTVAVG